MEEKNLENLKNLKSSNDSPKKSEARRTKNRLNLDFTLITNIERSNFLTEYLSSPIFQSYPPTKNELEICADYVLWGKDPATQKNAAQLKEIQLEPRNKTWVTSHEESLDALLESPTFQESQFLEHPAPRPKRIKFSREEARVNATPEALETLENLWTHIDYVELLNNFYEIFKEKRTKPPRAALLEGRDESELLEIKEKAKNLSQFQYLKMRHLLVEMRREQYTIRDTYQPQLARDVIDTYNLPTRAQLGTEIKILPLGLFEEEPIYKKIFAAAPLPENFSEKELEEVSRILWANTNTNISSRSDIFFDFREVEHLYNFFLEYEKICIEAEQSQSVGDIESNLGRFLKTLEFYVARANLSEMYKEILELKIRKFKNQEIADVINQKYEKTYNANYISTIFRQKIIPLVNKAAAYHFEVVGNLFFKENFKKCSKCGEKLLLCSENFMHKAKSKDGFSAHCKKCDKESRERRKEELSERKKEPRR